MFNRRTHWLAGLILALTQFSGIGEARFADLTHQTMADVMKVARAIAVVQPYLSEAKYIEYGLGIHRASRRYGILPSILIAITQQETGFRDNLPEGRAGEIGICQIRKMWLKHPKFKAEFKHPTLRDLRTPLKSFMMAAWILRDIKITTKSKTLPFWSYYNAVRFENRFRYFLRVNRNIAALRRSGETYSHGVGAAHPKEEARATTPVTSPKTSSTKSWLEQSIAALRRKDFISKDQLVRAASALDLDMSAQD